MFGGTDWEHAAGLKWAAEQKAANVTVYVHRSLFLQSVLFCDFNILKIVFL